MKKLLFILLLGIFFIPIFKVEAMENFYDAEYIPSIYMIRERNGTKLYQQARFIRKSNSGEIAYCIEPFAFLDDRHDYQERVNINDLDDETLRKMALISYFGYQYQNHQDDKWYAITQILIWKTSDQNASFYFTDRLNGNYINPYEEEEKEILELVEKANQVPSFNGKKHTILVGDSLILEDSNNVLENFTISSDKKIKIKKENNSLIIDSIRTEGKHQITLNRTFSQYQNPPILYKSDVNQNILTVGNPRDIKGEVTIETIPSEVTIKKIDFINQSTTPSGDANLIGATFGLFNDDELIDTYIMDEKLIITIKNLPSDNYYFKELDAGEGYQINDTVYKFNLSTSNPKEEITIYNKVIEGKLVIHKQYGEEDQWLNEEGIAFNIYNKEDNLIDTIITDGEGYAEIVLPYGEYRIVQINSTDGYHAVDSFIVKIDEQEKEYVYQLKDYEIDVPDTKSSIPRILSIELDEKKKYFTSYYGNFIL